MPIMTEQPETYTAIPTALGVFHGRETLLLDDVDFVDGRAHLRLHGIVRTAHTTGAPRSLPSEVACEILFHNVVGLTLAQPDMARHPVMIDGDDELPGESAAFIEVHNSGWLRLLTEDYRNRLLPDSPELAATRHLILHAEDETLEILCTSFELKVEHPAFNTPEPTVGM